MTVAQLLKNATAAEIGEWHAFYALERHEDEERRGKRPKQLKPKAKAAMLRSWFGHKVVKQPKGA